MSSHLPASLPLLMFAAGIALTAAEAFIPGAHFIVVGIALLIAGLVGLLLPGVLAGPVALAIVTLVVGAVTFYAYRNFDLYGGERDAAPRGSDSLKGSVGTVTERVTRSGGEVKVEDGGFNPYYRARSLDEEIPEGEQVMVIDPGGGNVVTVTAMGSLEGGIDRDLAADRAATEGGRPAEDPEDLEREEET